MYSFSQIFGWLRLKASATDNTSALGDLQTLSSDSTVHLNNGTTSSSILTATHSAEGVGRVQNKDLDASNVQFVDPTDTTKKANFSLSGATTGTELTIACDQTSNITITLPGSSSDTVVTENGIQTLTNKTISASNNTITDLTDASIASGADIALSKLAPLGDNELVITDGSGVITSTALGDNEVIVTNGSGIPTTLANGPDGDVLTMSGGTQVWASNPASILNYKQTGINYTLLSSDDVIIGTNNITLTLPDVATNPGKLYRIVSDTSPPNIVTITASGSDHINVNGTSFSSIGLGYLGEAIELVSSGSVGLPIWTMTNLNMPQTLVVNTTTTGSATNIGSNASAYFATAGGGTPNLTLADPTKFKYKSTVIQCVSISLGTILNVLNSDSSLLTTLNTVGETITLLSDGTSWNIINRYIPATWNNFTAVFTSSNGPSHDPVPPGALTSAFWRRVGDSIEIKFIYNQVGGGSGDGTGDYIFQLPGSGLTFNTSLYTITANSGEDLGTFYFMTGSPITRSDPGRVYPYTFTGVGLAFNTDSGGALQSHVDVFGPARGDGFNTSDLTISFHFIAAIQGWNT